MPTAPPPAALIFDMDGVLIANSPFYVAAWRELGTRYPALGLDRFPGENTFGRRNLDLFEMLIPDQRHRWAALGEELEAIYWERFQPHLRPIPGLDALLAEARRRGLKLAVATSAPPASMARVVGGLGWLDPARFDVILTEADVTRGKPDPEIYRRACQRLACPPAAAVVFEDAIVGVQAARAAGATVLGLATSYPESVLVEAGAGWVMQDYLDPRLPQQLGWTVTA